MRPIVGLILRVWYSVAIAISVAASTWGSTRNINFWTRVGVLAAAFFAALSAAYFFQGPDIEEAFRRKSIEASVKIKDSVSPEVEVKVEKENSKVKAIFIRSKRGQQYCTANSFASVGSQLGIAGIYIGTNVINRYFLLDTIWSLFGITASASAFWWVFGASYFVKFMFDFTNEGFATSEAIAQYFNGNRPFYARFFRPLSYAPIRKSTRFLGALDHTLIDDLLPWLGYLPKEAVTYLAQNRNAMIAVASIGSVTGGLLAILVYAQTYFYEGSRTEKNLLKIANQLKEMPEKDLPAFIGKKLTKTINLMAPLHGAASAMPIYFIVKELLVNSSGKWAVDIALTLLVFLGVAIGVYYSEVKEAKKEIAERTLAETPSEKQALLQVSESSSGVSINSEIGQVTEDHSMIYCS